MKNKFGFAVLAVILLFFVVFGSVMAGKNDEDGDYDGAYYVEANGNLIVKGAKIIDKGCFYVVDIFVSGIGSIFNTILGN